MISGRRTIAVIILLASGFNGMQVLGDEVRESAEPLALRAIMQELGNNMQAITDGISREDWSRVAAIAPLIADHPQPPFFEKMRILKYVGSEVATFKGYDGKTHAAARALGEAAAGADGEAVIATFATLQKTCLACHEQFRRPFVAHFYGQD